MKSIIKKLLREGLDEQVLQNIITKTNENMSQFSNWFEWVPVEYLDSIKEFDRGGASKEHFVGNIKEIMDSVMKEGFKDTVRIAYYPTDDTVLLEEGNHRLKVAKLLGLQAVPALVVRNRGGWHGDDSMSGASNQLSKVKKVRGPLDKEKYRDRFDPKIWRVPDWMKPSFIGIPTINL